MRRALSLPVIALLLASSLATAQPNGRQVYVVDPDASDIHWLVYKAGAFSRFGHNHVISADGWSGSVTIDTADPSGSTFELELPVANLVIDDPGLRAGLGEEFSSVPSDSDIAGTRGNMLGDRVLNGGLYPVLRITGVGPSGGSGRQTLQVDVELLGRSVPLTLPTAVTIEGDTLEAAGEFELSHAELGMRPFSVMAGALQVDDRMSFSYRIRAHAQ